MKQKSPTMVEAGRKAAHTRKWGTAQRQAALTARWATTMARWLVAHSTTGRPWQIVGFPGSAGCESAGIVDLIAARRNYSPTAAGAKPGDLFEFLFIQVKGGTARWPALADVERMRRSAAHHRAKAVVLCEWKKGERLVVHTLSSDRRPTSVRAAWVRVDDPAAFFSSPRARGRVMMRARETQGTIADIGTR